VNSWNPAINGVSATAADWQNLANDIAAALTQSLSSDGQTPVTGNLPMTGNKLTGLGAGSATGDSVRWEQLFSQGTPLNLVSAATTDIGAQNSVFLNITGTTTITSFGTNYNGPRYLRFDSALTLTHNATTLILPGAANITTTAGDSAIVVPSGSPANGWRLFYFPAVGAYNSTQNGQLAGMRNKIINGKMDVAQRGTSFVGISAGQYTLDRFAAGVSGGGAVTVTQQADAPSDNEFQNSLRYAVNTADTSIAAGDFGRISQSIEGYNVKDLIGKTFTLSFWVRSSKTGTHCIGFTNNGADRSYVLEYTVSAANTWEKKSVTVTGGLITAGTWDWTNNVGVRVSWCTASGSTYQTTAGSWQTGNFFATANQVNCLDTIGNIFAITGVQLEVGSVATPFEHRPYATELALCKRYYETAPWNQSSGSAANRPFYQCTLYFQVEKRGTPTMSTPGGGTFNTAAGASSPTYANIGLNSFRIEPSNANVWDSVSLNWAASAEL
jgi:hypothetical protein